ncbi:error-prone repair protein UmuD [Halorhodospira halochloris]|uniref:Error-prone repair protein UmuD n=1 Tax=Halorhodospira halochloris TaxID=1052 RepID=A0A0X8X9H7_HALHR|nr:translesion error-prone DNA polymerase V autoproteolytic subunit [Halorhodospira halochloris]MBK1652534.1 UV protection and mutation protein [Halorhodospira halochloris]MCG5548718.1 translesion error-prone DNA polymerase V autoproteolytic subunit [Halorhodospira halochloris]BAU57859.1 error-prone repair protein UmuD [Halorhodospira halochloris]
MLVTDPQPCAKEPTKLRCPLFLESVTAGFPSPAQDYVDRALDLNELCIDHPAATYFVRAAGESMLGAGIHPGDVLVVDRAIEAKHNDIVIAAWQGELTVKRLELRPNLRLVAENEDYAPIAIPDPEMLEIFGVVTFVIHALR